MSNLFIESRFDTGIVPKGTGGMVFENTIIRTHFDSLSNRVGCFGGTWRSSLLACKKKTSSRDEADCFEDMYRRKHAVLAHSDASF